MCFCWNLGQGQTHYVSQKNILLPLCKWEPFRRELIAISSLKSALLLNFFSWWKALLAILCLSQKPGRHRPQPPSRSFPFPRQGFLPVCVPSIFSSLCLCVLLWFRMSYFLESLPAIVTLRSPCPQACHPLCHSKIFLLSQIWLCHFTGQSVWFSSKLEGENSKSLA